MPLSAVQAAASCSDLPAPLVSLRPGRRLARLAGLALVLAPLPGCQSVVGDQPISQVRIIDTSPDAGGLDVYQGTGVLAYNLGLGTVTSYVPIAPGTYTIALDHAGTAQQVAVQPGTFAANGQYTVLVGNYLAGLQEMILKDQSQPAPAGQIALRFLDQATRAGRVDLYLLPTGATVVTGPPILTNVAFGKNTGYLNFPAGTYTLAALPAGTVPTATSSTSYTGNAVVYSSGSAQTLILIDQQLAATPGLQVIAAHDYDSLTATQ